MQTACKQEHNEKLNSPPKTFNKIASLRRFKDDVREVNSGYECGVGIEKFNDIREGDTLEAFSLEEIAR